MLLFWRGTTNRKDWAQQIDEKEEKKITWLNSLTPRTLYWFPHFKQELHEHFSNQREFKKGIVRTLQFMNIRTNSHTHHIQHTDTPEKKLWYQMRQLSLSEVCLHEEPWVCKQRRHGRKKKKKNRGISGKKNIWEMTAYRRVKPEGGTANASQRHWEDSSCGRWNNSSL